MPHGEHRKVTMGDARAAVFSTSLIQPTAMLLQQTRLPFGAKLNLAPPTRDPTGDWSIQRAHLCFPPEAGRFPANVANCTKPARSTNMGLDGLGASVAARASGSS